MGVRGLAAIAAAAVVALTSAGAAHATFPGGNGRIAYLQVLPLPNRLEIDLWTVNPDGSAPRNLTADVRGIAFVPASSPDGTKLAFLLDESGSTWWEGTLDAPGLVARRHERRRDRETHIRKISGLFPTVAWSPDGTRLVTSEPGPFVPAESLFSRSRLVVMNADGSDPVAITAPNEDAFGPSWSPDGRAIAFSGDREPRRRDPPRIYVVAPDGSGLRRVTTGEYADWAPDGSRLLVAGGESVKIVRPDGTGITRVRGFSYTTDAPRWSPDGTKIVYADEEGRADLLFANPDGTCTTEIPGRPRDAEEGRFFPVWQPVPGGAPSAERRCVDLVVGPPPSQLHGAVGRRMRAGLTLSNIGNEPARAVRVRLENPGDFAIVSARANGRRCASRGSTVCSFARLAPGAFVRISIVLRPRRGGERWLSLLAEMRGDDADESTNTSLRPVVVCSHFGTNGPDVLRGTPGDDIICARGGDDRIFAGDGEDAIFAGAGNDLVWAGDGPDLVDAGAGDDSVAAGGGQDWIGLGAGDDVVYGGAGNDRLGGSDGRDRLYAERGDDQMSSVDRLVDSVDGGPGEDSASADRRDRVRSVERLSRRRGTSGTRLPAWLEAFRPPIP